MYTPMTRGNLFRSVATCRQLRHKQADEAVHAATRGEAILTTDLAIVLLLLAAAIAMFIAERPRMDMVA